MSGGSETDNEDVRIYITKTRNGLTPIFIASEGFAFIMRDFFAVLAQSRAKLAGDDFGIDTGNGFHKTQYYPTILRHLNSFH
jgi:hypothetical protein